MEKLINKARTYTTAQILNAIRLIPLGNISEEQRMVRAALIEVYWEREGDEKTDALFNELGL